MITTILGIGYRHRVSKTQLYIKILQSDIIFRFRLLIPVVRGSFCVKGWFFFGGRMFIT